MLFNATHVYGDAQETKRTQMTESGILLLLLFFAADLNVKQSGNVALCCSNDRIGFEQVA